MISDELLIKAVLEVDQAILDMLPSPEDCTHVFSKSFEKKIKKLIYKTNHFVMYSVIRYAACILITLLLSGGIFLTVNPDARAAMMDWIKETFQDVYYYFFIGEETENNKSYSPDWLPEGYKETNQIKDQSGDMYIYLNDSDEMLLFAYVYPDHSYSLTIGDGEYDHKYITTGDLNAEIFLALEDDKTSTITWIENNGSVIFTISGNITEAELIRIAQSVTPK